MIRPHCMDDNIFAGPMQQFLQASSVSYHAVENFLGKLNRSAADFVAADCTADKRCGKIYCYLPDRRSTRKALHSMGETELIEKLSLLGAYQSDNAHAPFVLSMRADENGPRDLTLHIFIGRPFLNLSPILTKDLFIEWELLRRKAAIQLRRRLIPSYISFLSSRGESLTQNIYYQVGI